MSNYYSSIVFSALMQNERVRLLVTAGNRLNFIFIVIDLTHIHCET